MFPAQTFLIPTTVIHDYSSVLILILWLLGFWWFSYSFVLEEKLPVMQEKATKV